MPDITETLTREGTGTQNVQVYKIVGQETEGATVIADFTGDNAIVFGVSGDLASIPATDLTQFFDDHVGDIINLVVASRGGG
jgi:hypothetical protein